MNSLNPKGLGQRVVELIVALILLGFIVQTVLAVIQPYIAYAVLGVVIFLVATLIYRNKTRW